jgi:hypothetical protein
MAPGKTDLEGDFAISTLWKTPRRALGTARIAAL